jgi:hypothetical protein
MTAKKPRITGNPTGRPTSLDAETADRLLQALRMGNPFATAAEFAGIDNSTLTRWRQRGEDALAIPPGRRNATQRKFADFCTAFRRAVVEANVRMQSQIYAVGSKDLVNASPEQQRIIVDAAKFHLTHRDPKNYNTQVGLEVSGPNGGPVQVDGKAALEMLRELADDE